MIVGVGEILWDIYPGGRHVIGGAPFNFTFHCHQLGHPASIVSRVGDDALGREVRERVRALGLSDEYIQTDPALPTGTVRVSVDAAGQPAYAIDMQAAWGNLEWTPALAALARRVRALCHGTLALRGGPGSRRVILELAHQVKQNGGLTIYDVNLRARNAEIPVDEAVRLSTWLKVNEDEVGPLFAPLGGGVARETCVQIMAEPGNRDRAIIVTRGAAGAEVFVADQHFHESAPPATVIDTVGAGDAFTAAMVCLHLEGKTWGACVRFANHYAARVCEHQGGTPLIDRASVENAALGRAG